MIRWAYRSKINDSVYCMNEDGELLNDYDGRFPGQGPRILDDSGPQTEFYISFSGQGGFVKVTREQWEKP